MDPLDRAGAEQEPKSAKAARSYAPIPWEKERWDIGLPHELDLMMAKRGVGIYPWEELGASEVPFYPWASDEGLVKSIAEADRAIAAGAMEYVPAHRIEEVQSASTIHPWTIVDQGGGKWRLCHDYSVGTNRHAPTAAFTLPSVWDVAPVVEPGSFFAKYDIRDGFWHVPIGEDSKKRLVVRHPGTGRLMWATRLPFGYLDSPRLFCGLTEALMSRLRSRAAREGKAINFFVFVDDALIVGADEELTRLGMRWLEEEFSSRGVQWAPHKKRGPCKCIEFLGLLMSNIEGARGITITSKRLSKLQLEMEDWAKRDSGAGFIEVEPKPLASLLGKLVFVSQVVPGGRTYMQGMLSQFQGLVVNWTRGTVTVPQGKGVRMGVSRSFWRDLSWWRNHLVTHSLSPFTSPSRRAEAALLGTDASGYGTGQVLWLDGGREESTLVFTAAEKRRPINWRELLGVVRACALGGERLRGKVALVETDNMAAYGAASKLSSKSADMQELVRRLLRLSQKHGFELRVTHTPGEKLDRPDQTSRGDAEEEPRARLTRRLFDQISSRWGPFSSYLGAEREYAAPDGGRQEEPGRGARQIWAHPTVSTVGTTMRRLQEELAWGGVGGATAVAVVPDSGAGAWDKLSRQGVVVGRLGAGTHALEMNTLGQWRPCRVERPTRVMLFPRAAGSVPRRLRLSLREGATVTMRGGAMTTAGAGYVQSSCGTFLRLPVLPGSFVYSLPQDMSQPGWLYQVCERTEEDMTGRPDAVELVSAILDRSKRARKASNLPVWSVSTKEQRWEQDPASLWAVDHLVASLPGSGGKTFAAYSFDWVQANAEATRAGGAFGDRATNG
ncbi:MAG: reverse transcriptase domain-containing protein, partial [Planctomycetota bacterium]|nr:reverse transcriptase domain-containing protein [Planctomycetota bacterium]